MKRMNYRINIVLCFLLIVSLLSSCKKDGADDDTKATEVSETVVVTLTPVTEEGINPTASALKEPIELSLGIWPPDTKPDEIALYEGYGKEFSITHPDIKVVPAYYSYTVDSFIPLAEAGKLPVIFQTYYTDTKNIIDGGYAADITDILDTRGWLNAINPSLKKLFSKDGRTYGIPCDGYALGLMVNVALFKEAGLVDADGLPMYPKTWIELAETGKKIKDATGAAGLCLLSMDIAAGWHFANIAWAFGAILTTENADGSITCNLDSAEAIAAMEYVKSLKWSYDILTVDPTVEDFNTGFTQLGTGACAMYIAASDTVALPTGTSGLPAKDLGLAPLPAGLEGEQYSSFGGSHYMFSKDATEEQINAAFDYLTIMGKGPVFDKESFETDCQYREESGIPVIYRFPNWTDQAVMDQETALINKYSNVDIKLYQDYFNIIKQESNLRMGGTGTMYDELSTVIHTVITEENADVAYLMKKADENYQSYLDSSLNNHQKFEAARKGAD